MASYLGGLRPFSYPEMPEMHRVSPRQWEQVDLDDPNTPRPDIADKKENTPFQVKLDFEDMEEHGKETPTPPKSGYL